MALGRVDAVLLDAFGTLVAMDPPAPRLQAELAARGIELGVDDAAAGFRAEIAYYLEHHGEGRDRESLEALRDRCAEVMRDALGRPDADLGLVREAMLAAIHFVPYPDVPRALRALRERGLRLVVVSNWDCSLGEVLREAGIRDLVDGVVTSAEAGAAKPAAAIFEAALELAGCPPGRVVHVGDSPSRDVAGAAAAGIAAVLLRRGDARLDEEAADARPAARPSAEITSLADLPYVL
jgi:putative hydrolase of the HAD superfamily